MPVGRTDLSIQVTLPGPRRAVVTVQRPLDSVYHAAVAVHAVFTSPAQTGEISRDGGAVLRARDEGAQMPLLGAQEFQAIRRIRTTRQRPHFVVVEEQVMAAVGGGWRSPEVL